MLELINKLHSNGNGNSINGMVEGNLIKMTLILKSDINGCIEIISSQSEPYKPQSVEIKKEKVKSKKIQYNPLTGVILNKLKTEFNNSIEVVETTVYLGIRLNQNNRYDMLITPQAKNKIKIDMPVEFLDLININYKTNNVFSYLGHLKIDNVKDFNNLLSNYKDHLEMY